MSKEENNLFSCTKYTRCMMKLNSLLREKKAEAKYNPGGKGTKRIGWEYVQIKCHQEPLLKQMEKLF